MSCIWQSLLSHNLLWVFRNRKISIKWCVVAGNIQFFSVNAYPFHSHLFEKLRKICKSQVASLIHLIWAFRYNMWNPRMEPWSEQAFGPSQCVYMSLSHVHGVGWVSTSCDPLKQTDSTGNNRRNDRCHQLLKEVNGFGGGAQIDCNRPPILGFICQA